MDKNYFKNTRILDGGMGQQLLAKGLISKGTLWSASALVEERNHQLVIDTHLEFINAGADVIITNSFSSRRDRLTILWITKYSARNVTTHCTQRCKVKKWHGSCNKKWVRQNKDSRAN